MHFDGQRILPAIRRIKDLEKLLDSSYTYLVLLDVHIAQLKHIVQFAKGAGKKLLLHLDLIQGMQSDGYAAEYICQEFQPYGILSTKTNVIAKAKQKKVIAVQRVFLLDSGSLEKSYALIEKNRPDFIEVLPGALTPLIREIREKTGIPILAGGFIRTPEDVERTLEAGAVAVTTSTPELWNLYRK